MTRTPAQIYYDEVRPDRDAWRDEMPYRCMACYCLPYTDVHEIMRKSQAPKSWGCRSNYLCLCRECHIEFDSLAVWPHARQLALKMECDPENYDLVAWNLVRHPCGKSPDFVTQAEVDWWIEN